MIVLKDLDHFKLVEEESSFNQGVFIAVASMDGIFTY